VWRWTGYSYSRRVGKCWVSRVGWEGKVVWGRGEGRQSRGWIAWWQTVWWVEVRGWYLDRALEWREYGECYSRGRSGIG